MKIYFTDGTAKEYYCESVAHIFGIAEHFFLKHPTEIEKVIMWPELMVPGMDGADLDEPDGL